MGATAAVTPKVVLRGQALSLGVRDDLVPVQEAMQARRAWTEPARGNGRALGMPPQARPPLYTSYTGQAHSRAKVGRNPHEWFQRTSAGAPRHFSRAGYRLGHQGQVPS